MKVELKMRKPKAIDGRTSLAPSTYQVEKNAYLTTTRLGDDYIYQCAS